MFKEVPAWEDHRPEVLLGWTGVVVVVLQREGDDLTWSHSRRRRPPSLDTARVVLSQTRDTKCRQTKESQQLVG